MSDRLNKALILSLFYALTSTRNFVELRSISFGYTIRLKTRSVKYFIINFSWELEIKVFSKSNFTLFFESVLFDGEKSQKTYIIKLIRKRGVVFPIGCRLDKF